MDRAFACCYYNPLLQAKVNSEKNQVYTIDYHLCAKDEPHIFHFVCHIIYHPVCACSYNSSDISSVNILMEHFTIFNVRVMTKSLGHNSHLK